MPLTLGAALSLARGRIDGVDARILLRHAAGVRAVDLVAYPERELSAEAGGRYLHWLARREAGEPVAYIIGEREFFGHIFRVSADTLIPRPDTELLVELALGRLQGQGAPRILDLGTGTGAIAISVALAMPGAVVTAVDASPAALAVAQENAQRLGAELRCLAGDWFAPVAGEVFDMVLSNPPYIAERDPHLTQADLRFEPRSALASGMDGLDDIARIVAAAGQYLVPGGCLLLEHGYDQAGRVRALLAGAGFAGAASWCDLAGIERVSGACRG